MERRLVDEAIAEMLDREASRCDVSLRELSRRSDVKLTRLGDVLRRGKAMTVGEFSSIARALGLVPWQVVKQADDSAEDLIVSGLVHDDDDSVAPSEPEDLDESVPAYPTPTPTSDDDAVVVTFPTTPPDEDDENKPTESDYLQMAALDPGYPPDAENEQ